MDSFVREKLHNEKSYRIRCMKSLIEQLKKDYSNLNKSIRKLKSDVINSPGMEEILQQISWIKREVNILRKLDSNNIEGILWGEIIEIEKKVIDMEMKIKRHQISHFL